MFRHMMALLFIMLPYVASANVLSATCEIPLAVDHFLDCFIEEQKNKNSKLIIVAKTAENNDCGEIVNIGFIIDFFGTVDIPAARQKVVLEVNNFLQEINKQDKLRCYFATFPLSATEVIMRIRFRPEECGFIFPKLGNVAEVVAMDGHIFYSTINSFTFALDNLRLEPFPQE